ncbi:MAG: GxxExxY protein [Saprospiraceae bacterium]|nr:GxxExxY protein [Saprospiraceae bacterium]
MDRALLNELGTEIIDAAYHVHVELGPGLLESAYQRCLSYELIDRGLKVELEKPLPLSYKEVALDCGYRIDILVESAIILELKTVESLAPIHTAQVLTYLKLSKLHLAYLLNFNVRRIKDGIKRIVH